MLLHECPIVVSYGMGVDSTAMLIGLHEHCMRPDLILFADTGGEKDSTYRFLPVIDAWLKSVGFPSIEIVKYTPANFKNWPPYYTLEDNCLTNGTLPSLAFGFKSCSLKWKVAPQDRYLKTWAPAQKTWADGGRVRKFIGYDCGPKDIRRRNHAGNQNDPRYQYEYPLIEWGWDRQRCEQVIQDAGLPVPPKSSCFFCPAMQPHEVIALDKEYLRRIVRMEARAAPRLVKVEGLWRTSTRKRPGSMTEYIAEMSLLPLHEIEAIRAATGQEIISYQEGYALAKRQGCAKEYEAAHATDDYRHGNNTR